MIAPSGDMIDEVEDDGELQERQHRDQARLVARKTALQFLLLVDRCGQRLFGHASSFELDLNGTWVGCRAGGTAISAGRRLRQPIFCYDGFALLPAAMFVLNGWNLAIQPPASLEYWR